MREPLLGVAVGKKGVGKTYTTDLELGGYVAGTLSPNSKPRKVLILDVNDEFQHVKAIALKDLDKFSAISKVEARRIRPFMPNGQRMTLKEVSEALFYTLNHFRGGLLLIEDINRYISDHLPKDVEGAICTNRHVDLDIILHFQSIGRVTSKIWQNINWLRFHKITDSVEKHSKKFEDKVEYLKIAEELVNHEYNNGNKHFYTYVDIDYGKIFGNFDKSLVYKAIDRYIQKNYKDVIIPMTKEVDLSGNKKYDKNTAVLYTQKKLRESYCR